MMASGRKTKKCRILSGSTILLSVVSSLSCAEAQVKSNGSEATPFSEAHMSDQSAFELLRQTVHTASTRFAQSLALFRAWHGNEGITEANITLQLALAFTSLH